MIIHSVLAHTQIFSHPVVETTVSRQRRRFLFMRHINEANNIGNLKEIFQRTSTWMKCCRKSGKSKWMLDIFSTLDKIVRVSWEHWKRLKFLSPPNNRHNNLRTFHHSNEWCITSPFDPIYKHTHRKSPSLTLSCEQSCHFDIVYRIERAKKVSPDECLVSRRNVQHCFTYYLYTHKIHILFSGPQEILSAFLLLLCMFFSIFSPHIPSLVLPIHNMSSFIFQLLLSTVVAARCCREHNIVLYQVYSGLLHIRFCRCCRLSAASPSWNLYEDGMTAK